MRLAQRLEVELCHDDGCARLASASPVEASQDVFLPHVDPGSVSGPLSIKATLFDRRGAVVLTSSTPVEFEVRHPNGDACPSETVLQSVTIEL